MKSPSCSLESPEQLEQQSQKRYRKAKGKTQNQLEYRHMNYLRTLIFVVSFLALNCAAEEQKFGLVVSADGTNFCASFGDSFGIKEPPVGAKIRVVAVERVQSAFEAEIGKKADACSPLEKAMVGGPYFSVFTKAAFSEPFVGIAVLGKNEAIANKGVVTLKAIGTQERIHFRLCTSSEALHFSAWYGKPFVGKQLWRQAYYLGYDVVPSCNEKDFQVGNYQSLGQNENFT